MARTMPMALVCFLLFHHAVPTRIFADLGRHNKHVVLADPANGLQCWQCFSAGQNDQNHVHSVGRAMPVKHGIATAIGLQIADDLFGALLARDQLQAGRAQGDLALQR